ncbi:hypothetical protein [Pseudomonas psychrophila]|uniref:Uncharacterized protein n=1 Tax=Pseudomonas psychrophila TaxID=122355 RepID=A0A8I1K9V0_9PSED|nr:hypothetical protein [Pseudomonas psychrophila]MBJ2259171.1 hypothetical protein [Pseudomonas psychrophila]
MSNIRQEGRGYTARSPLARYQKEKTPAKEMARVGAAFKVIAQITERLASKVFEILRNGDLLAAVNKVFKVACSFFLGPTFVRHYALHEQTVQIVSYDS